MNKWLNESDEKKKKSESLHKQFGHCSYQKLWEMKKRHTKREIF